MKNSEDKTKKQNILNVNNIPDMKHPLQRPYHIRLREYEKVRESIFGPSKRKIRSSKRIRDYYNQLKSFRTYVISPVISQELDKRPYISLRIIDQMYLALLDSGANKSVIGGLLAGKVQNLKEFRKCYGNVRTADGQKQDIVGTVKLDIRFQGRSKLIEFLIVPSIKQELICGFDFWTEFGLGISIPVIGEIDYMETDPDKLVITAEQRQRLDKVIAAFPNSDVEGLGCTILVEHCIDTGDAKPIKQRYYPISPAIEKHLCGELDRMLSLGVIEEAPSSPWSSPTVVIVKPGKIRMCVDSRKLNSVTIKDAYPIWTWLFRIT